MNVFTVKLLEWYAEHKRELPWRQSQNPYVIWLSEVILQQTRIAQGLPYFERFLHAFPSVDKLAHASEDEILKLWQGLGYYSRARNLHKAAKYVTHQLEGVFPSSYENLLSLPGVGPYTASAIASICYQQPTAVVDGNVYRVLARYFGIDTPINHPKGVRLFQELAQSLIDNNVPGDYNQAIMDFGSLQCTPKKPQCSECPLHESCQAYREGTTLDLPQKIKLKQTKKRYFHYLIPFDDNNHTILFRRDQKDIWQGLYEFPLLEGSQLLSETELKAHPDLPSWASTATWTLYQDKAMIHKLSHQELHTHFWVLENVKHPLTVPWEKVKQFGVPRLIERFLQKFKR